MWKIEVNWNGVWVPLGAGFFKTQDDAEWAIGQWKQQHKVYGDPFRTRETQEAIRAESHPSHP